MKKRNITYEKKRNKKTKSDVGKPVPKNAGKYVNGKRSTRSVECNTQSVRARDVFVRECACACAYHADRQRPGARVPAGPTSGGPPAVVSHWPHYHAHVFRSSTGIVFF